jgi:VCBS repeat protein
MALRLGIKKSRFDPYNDHPQEELNIIRPLNIYPQEPKLSIGEWKKIVAYYKKEAPSRPIEQKGKIPSTNKLTLFTEKEIYIGDKLWPSSTMLKFDESSSQLYVGDAEKALYIIDSKMQLIKTLKTLSAPVDIDFPKNAEPRLLLIGSMAPSDQKLGSLISINNNSGVNIQELPNPVQFAVGDINMDQKEDVIICGFGNFSGKLFWYDGFDSSKEHVLKAFPGSRKVEINDFNKDGKPDLIVLMAQAREQLSVFYNLGEGQFEEKVVLSFPPVFGVSYFELVDFNNDGNQDIILTNGDKWDFSNIYKNYHGIRLYINDGNDNFMETFFYPMYGAQKVIAKDFDIDGDIDIAAVSFSSDLEKPEQSFIYLSNDGNMNFKTFVTPGAANGKWLVMEAGDFDKDGDIDIVLGSYVHNLVELNKLIFNNVFSFPQLLLLTNESK